MEQQGLPLSIAILMSSVIFGSLLLVGIVLIAIL